VRNLERAEDISGDAMAAGIAWGWTTFAEFLDVLDALPKGIDYAAQIGHSALRTYVMASGVRRSGVRRRPRAMEAGAARRPAGGGVRVHDVAHPPAPDVRRPPRGLAPFALARRAHPLVEVVGEEGVGTFQMVQDRRRPRRRRHVTAGPSSSPSAPACRSRHGDGNATGRASAARDGGDRRRGGRTFA